MPTMAVPRYGTAMVGIVSVVGGNYCKNVTVVDGLDPDNDVAEVCGLCDSVSWICCVVEIFKLYI